MQVTDVQFDLSLSSAFGEECLPSVPAERRQHRLRPVGQMRV